MVLYLIKFVNVDTRKFEDIFVKLVRSEWTEDDEESFPFDYKIEFIALLATVFNDNGFFSKSEDAIIYFKKNSLKNIKAKFIIDINSSRI